MKKEVLPFDGAWAEAFGHPEAVGTWLIWGNSGNGKTSLAMQLLGQLTKWRRCLLVSLEEGTSLTMQESLARHGLAQSRRLQIVTDTMEELAQRLGRRGSPEVVLIDSFQYTQMSYRNYLGLRRQLGEQKLLIFTSHAAGKLPAGKAAVSVMYDATMKIYVEGYRAFSKGRFIGPKGHLDIWPERAARYWDGL